MAYERAIHAGMRLKYSVLMVTLYQLSIWRLRCQVCGDLQVTIPCHQLLTQAFGRLQAICQRLDLCLRG